MFFTSLHLRILHFPFISRTYLFASFISWHVDALLGNYRETNN
jgi:hypothetical protein